MTTKVLQCVKEGSRRVRVMGCDVRNLKTALAGFEDHRPPLEDARGKKSVCLQIGIQPCRHLVKFLFIYFLIN